MRDLRHVRAESLTRFEGPPHVAVAQRERSSETRWVHFLTLIGIYGVVFGALFCLHVIVYRSYGRQGRTVPYLAWLDQREHRRSVARRQRRRR